MSARMAILLRGLPGSGKTTTAALLRDALSPSVRVSDDSVRYMAHPRDFTALTLEASERACIKLVSRAGHSLSVFRSRIRRLASFTSLTVRPGSVSLGCLAMHPPRNRLPLMNLRHTTLALSYCDSGFLPIIDGVFMDAGFLIHQVLRFRRYGYQLIVISLVADISDLINRNLSRDPFAQMDEKRIRELHSTFSPVGFPLGIRDKLPEEVRDDILTIVESQETAGQAGSREDEVDLLFLRHGTPESPQGTPGAFETPLSPQGRGEALAARTAVRRFAPDVVFSSDSACALETARLACDELEIIVDPALREYSPLGLTGMPSDEIRHAPGRQAAETESGKGDAVGVPPGDSYDDARKRVRSFFNGLTEAHRGKRVLIVGHSDQHAWLIERAIGTELKAARLPRWDTGCFSRFTLSAHQTRLEAMNTGPESVVRDLDPGPPPENFTQNCRTEADWKPRHHP